MGKRDALRLNTGAQDPFFFTTTNNPFSPEAWSTVNNYLEDRVDLSAKILNGLGGTSSWSLAKVADCAAFVRLDLTLSALSGGSGGSYLAWQDWAAYSVIDQVQVSYAGNRLQTLQGEDIVEMIKSFASEEEVAAERAMAAGDLPLGARQVRAASAQVVRGRLPLFFTVSPQSALPICSLAHEITIDVTYKTLANSVETDHTSITNLSGSITAQTLEVNYVHLTPADRAALVAGTTSRTGFLYKFLDIERQRTTLVSDASTTTFSTALNAIRNPVQFLQVSLRKASALTSTTGGNRYYDYLSLGPSGTLRVHTNGEDVWAAVTEREIEEDIHNRYWPHAPAFSKLYKLPFAMDPANRVDSSGSLNLGMGANPTLEIAFGYTLPNLYGTSENIVLDVKAWVQNTMQIRSGDVQKLFV